MRPGSPLYEMMQQRSASETERYKHQPTVRASLPSAAGPPVTADFLGEAKSGKYRVIGDQDEKTPLFKDKGLKEQITQLKRDTVVEVKAFARKDPASKDDKSLQPHIANVKTDDGKEGWMRLANLARE